MSKCVNAVSKGKRVYTKPSWKKGFGATLFAAKNRLPSSNFFSISSVLVFIATVRRWEGYPELLWVASCMLACMVVQPADAVRCRECGYRLPALWHSTSLPPNEDCHKSFPLE
eukprot:6459841-Amphidinium_carterae.2